MLLFQEFSAGNSKSRVFWSFTSNGKTVPTTDCTYLTSLAAVRKLQFFCTSNIKLGMISFSSLMKMYFLSYIMKVITCKAYAALHTHSYSPKTDNVHTNNQSPLKNSRWRSVLVELIFSCCFFFLLSMQLHLKKKTELYLFSETAVWFIQH